MDAAGVRDTQDEPPVASGDLTDLLRACLVALRLPQDAARGAGTWQPPRLPFWSIRDAATRITRLVYGRPEGIALTAFLPEIAADAPNRARHCRTAVATTFAAGLELTRNGALTLEQELSWQPIRVRGRDHGLQDGQDEPAATSPALP